MKPHVKAACLLLLLTFSSFAALADIVTWSDARQEVENWINKIIKKEDAIPSHRLCLLRDSLEALEKGADVKGKEGRRAVYTAAALGRRDIFDFLILKGADPGEGRELDSFLREAVCGGCIPIVEWLCKRGADVNSADKRTGSTPLMLAACRNDRAMVGFLLARLADPDAVNEVGETAADYAQRSEHAELAQFLRETMKKKPVEGEAGDKKAAPSQG